MGCSNGNLLTERQVELLKGLLNEYHNKDMGICSCDVERVLGRTEIGLTKLELSIIIGAFVESVGIEELSKQVDEHTLKRVDEEAVTICYNSSPKQMHEAGISVFNKIIQGFVEENQSPPLTK